MSVTGGDFISSIGLRSGEENHLPQLDAGNNWMNVDWFLHTWGFLPTDQTKIKEINDDAKNELILLLLDCMWRKMGAGTQKKGIAIVKERIKEHSDITYFKEFKEDLIANTFNDYIPAVKEKQNQPQKPDGVSRQEWRKQLRKNNK